MKPANGAQGSTGRRILAHEPHPAAARPGRFWGRRAVGAAALLRDRRRACLPCMRGKSLASTFPAGRPPPIRVSAEDELPRLASPRSSRGRDRSLGHGQPWTREPRWQRIAGPQGSWEPVCRPAPHVRHGQGECRRAVAGSGRCCASGMASETAKGSLGGNTVLNSALLCHAVAQSKPRRRKCGGESLGEDLFVPNSRLGGHGKDRAGICVAWTQVQRQCSVRPSERWVGPGVVGSHLLVKLDSRSASNE